MHSCLYRIFKKYVLCSCGSFVLLPLGVNWEVQPADFTFSEDITGIDNVLQTVIL